MGASNFKRLDIIKTLCEGVKTVTFEKKNGEIREMPCTLNDEFLPVVPVKVDPDSKPRAVNEAIVSVYATDVNGWRSFRVDSVISIK